MEPKEKSKELLRQIKSLFKQLNINELDISEWDDWDDKLIFEGRTFYRDQQVLLDRISMEDDKLYFDLDEHDYNRKGTEVGQYDYDDYEDLDEDDFLSAYYFDKEFEMLNNVLENIVKYLTSGTI